MSQNFIKVQTQVQGPLKTVWNLWTDPMHILKWYAASDDWQTSYAENDAREGGYFLFHMEAKDGSVGFDFNGQYTKVNPETSLEYILADKRKVKITFNTHQGNVQITEEFEPETSNSHEMQRSGWQAILDNFKKYIETNNKYELLKFSIDIQAPVEKVYKCVLAENTYNQWTKAFNPTSHYIGSWDKRSVIRFIGEDGNGEVGGMISRIRENIPNKFVSIEHLGIIKKDKEVLSGPEVADWAGVLENYKWTAKGNHTFFEACLESNQEFKDYFLDTWPKALIKLKELCEKS